MKRKLLRIVSLIMIVVLAFALTSCGRVTSARLDDSIEDPADYVWPEEPEQVYSLRVATGIAATTPSGETLLKLKEVLEEESNGAVTLDIFWESTLGGALEIGEGLKIGSIEIGLISSAIISNYTTSIDVFSLPFIIKDREQFKVAADLIKDDIYAGIQETLGTPMGIWESGYRHLCTRDKKVETLEDCKGLTIRVMDGQVYSETFKALGCIPSNIALSELVPALQQGTIDGAEEPAAIVANQQQYSFCKYMAMLGYNYTVMVPILSNQTIKDYPPEVISLVERVFDEYRYYPTDLGQQYEDMFLQTCAEGGMEITYLSDEEMEKFKEAVAPIWETYADSIGQDLIDKVSNAKAE